MHKLKTMLLQFNRAFFPVNLFVSLFLIALLLKYPPDIIRITSSVTNGIRQIKAGIITVTQASAYAGFLPGAAPLTC
jgi:membrane protein YqaA with SNARE-associated domain